MNELQVLLYNGKFSPGNSPTPAGAINRASTFSGNKLSEKTPMELMGVRIVYSSSDEKRMEDSHQFPDLSRSWKSPPGDLLRS
jgi:hypothetical protein